MKTLQDFPPYNGLQWGPNGLRSKSLHLIEVHYMEENPGMFSSKTLISFGLNKETHGRVSKLSAK